MATQVNIRLDEDLLSEIDIISKVLHITRTEWMRAQIARAAKEDTMNLMESIVLEYSRGRITDEELNEILGSDAEDIRYIVGRVKKGKRRVDELVKKGAL